MSVDRERQEDLLLTCINDDEGTSEPEDVKPTLLLDNEKFVPCRSNVNVPSLVMTILVSVRLCCALIP